MHFVRTLSSAAALSNAADRTMSAGSLSQVWANYRKAKAVRAVLRATRAELAALDDCALADIGIHRSQIEQHAQDAAARARARR
jgi:uncharacterized protein YjiS (DUF1127 family)